MMRTLLIELLLVHLHVHDRLATAIAVIIYVSLVILLSGKRRTPARHIFISFFCKSVCFLSALARPCSAAHHLLVDSNDLEEQVVLVVLLVVLIDGTDLEEQVVLAVLLTLGIRPSLG